VIAVREVPPIPTEAPPEVEETVPATTAPPDQKEPPQVSATRYFAYDLRKDLFLLQKGDGNAKLYPASITKLLTCHVVLQYLDPADKVTVGDAMNLVQFDSSLADLKEGDELTVEQLVAAMMLPSGNDAAQVAAVAAGRAIAGNSGLSYTEAVEAFVKEMENQSKRYVGIYKSLLNLKQEGINITGMTLWGVSDADSWLRDQSNIGGGNTGSVIQHPLLFDDNCQPKEAFWVIVEESGLEYDLTVEDEAPEGDILNEDVPEEDSMDEQLVSGNSGTEKNGRAFGSVIFIIWLAIVIAITVILFRGKKK
jgi:hypothetical protein